MSLMLCWCASVLVACAVIYYKERSCCVCASKRAIIFLVKILLLLFLLIDCAAWFHLGLVFSLFFFITLFFAFLPFVLSEEDAL